MVCLAVEETGDNQGPQASLAPRLMWAKMGLLGFLEKRVSLVCKVLQDSLDQRVPQVLRGKMEFLGILDKEENWASKVRQAPLDQLVFLVLRGKVGDMGPLGERGPQGPLGLLVNKVFQA